MDKLPINQLLCGDAAELMKKLPGASIHAIITDPPYGLEFMGEEWDKFVPKDYPNAEAWRGRRSKFKMSRGGGIGPNGLPR